VKQKEKRKGMGNYIPIDNLEKSLIIIPMIF